MKTKQLVFLFACVILLILGISLFVVSMNRKEGAKKMSEKEDISYYTCGMHPQIRVNPREFIKGYKKCPICHMDLIPVEKSGGPMEKMMTQHKIEPSSIVIPPEQIRRANIQVEKIEKRILCKSIRTVGTVAYDPDLLVAEEELISSLASLDAIEDDVNPEVRARARGLVESSKKKLALLGLSQEQIEKIAHSRKEQKGLILPDETMWVYGDLYEYEISWVHAGSSVVVTSESFPADKFYGVISAMDPVIDAKTRSVKFRAQIGNPQMKLKPNMYVDVLIEGYCAIIKGEKKVLALPKDAVLDTGLKRIVWVEVKPGRFESRNVDIGAEGESLVDEETRSFYPVISGVKEGELVATQGNFLIDSQSQISGSVESSFGGSLEHHNVSH